MPSYYLQNTFFNTYHRFEGGEGKRMRDSLAEKFSFLIALGSDDLSNAAKRDAKVWSDGDAARTEAAGAIRDRFGMTIDCIQHAADNGYAGAPGFREDYAETFSKARARRRPSSSRRPASTPGRLSGGPDLPGTVVRSAVLTRVLPSISRIRDVNGAGRESGSG